MKGQIALVMRLLEFVVTTLVLFCSARPVQGWIAPCVAESRPSQLSMKASQNVDDATAQLPQKEAPAYPDVTQIISASLKQLRVSNGSDIRGRFVDHATRGPLSLVAHAIQDAATDLPSLTPFAAYCIGNALATPMVLDRKTPLTIAIGMDPRTHGSRLADALARGAEAVEGARVVFTGIATTPACANFVRLQKCDAAVVRNY